MTTRPTDEDIRVMSIRLREEESNDTTEIEAANMLEAWLAERQAARDWVTDEMVERACETMALARGWKWSQYQDGHKEIQRGQMRAALQSIAQPVRMPDEMVRKLCKLAKHADDCLSHHPLPTGEGNWHCSCGYDNYVLDGEPHPSILSASPQPQQAAPDGWMPIETAPKDGTTILLACRDRVTVGDWISMEMLKNWDGNDFEPHWQSWDGGFIAGSEHDATHWIPLPTAPAYNGKKEG